MESQHVHVCYNHYRCKTVLASQHMRVCAWACFPCFMVKLNFAVVVSCISGHAMSSNYYDNRFVFLIVLPDRAHG